MQTSRALPLLLALLLVLPLLAAGCGDDDGDNGADSGDDAAAVDGGDGDAAGSGDGGPDADAAMDAMADAAGGDVPAPDFTAGSMAVGIASMLELCGQQAGDNYSGCAADQQVTALMQQGELVADGVDVSAEASGYTVAVTAQSGITYTVTGSADSLELTCDGDSSLCENGMWDNETAGIEGLRGDRAGG